MAKKIIIVLLACMPFMTPTVGAQTFIDSDSTLYGVDEAYLATLFRKAEVIFCKIDTVNGGICVKNMEVSFCDDSAFFYTAYIESTFYRGTIAAFYPLVCSYVELGVTNGGILKLSHETLDEDEQSLDDLILLKPVLDSLLQKTVLMDCSKDTEEFIDLGKD
ncbi:MAG: hypothetical protein NTY80_01805 [candidate division SR1 bacterium]|nr:hypothetical protein [candidate division SR1 bacterium]